MKKILVAVALLLVVGLGALKLKSNKEKTEQQVYVQDPELKVGVGVSPVTIQPVSQAISYLGTFQANKEVDIKPQIGGEVTAINFQNGQAVRAGALLIKIDDEQLGFQKEGLDISIEGYKNDLKRYTNLVAGDAAPAVNIEKTNLQIRAAEAQKKQIDKQIAFTKVTAPFSGIITEKLTEKGAVVSPGAPIARLTDISQLKLRLMVPEQSINLFKIGQKLTVTTEVYAGQEFTGTVSLIGAKGDASHNYPIELTVQNNQSNLLRAGMYGSVAFDHSVATNALTIPRKALVGSTKDPQVFVINNNVAELRKISVGASTNDVYVITDGLKEGDVVVVSGQINLKNGTPVSINK